jgi:hypothetical protein
MIKATGLPRRRYVLLCFFSLFKEKQSLINMSACLHACAYAHHASIPKANLIVLILRHWRLIWYKYRHSCESILTHLHHPPPSYSPALHLSFSLFLIYISYQSVSTTTSEALLTHPPHPSSRRKSTATPRQNQSDRRRTPSVTIVAPRWLATTGRSNSSRSAKSASSTVTTWQE